MKRTTFLCAALAVVSIPTFAGGLLTNTNQNIAFLRNPARDGAIGIDGVYSNPAGVTWLNRGFHLSINLQSAYQTREVTSTFLPFAYKASDPGNTTRLFKGKAKAPVVPSYQLAYNTDRWSFSSSFAVGGGGGKCTFDDGLGSFESQAALLALVGKEMGINRYDLDSYMRGRQYYYGFQLGAGYKITEHLAAFAGARVVYASSNYYGYVKNIQVNNPETGEMTSASGLFQANYEKAVGAATAFKVLAEQATAAGNAALAAGDEALAAQYAQQAATHMAQAQEMGEKARQMGTLAVATQDVDLNCDQTGWGLTPVLGLDFKYGKFNVGAKYEFKTRMRLKNRAANSASAANLSALDMYRDGRKVAADIPALLTVGAQYEILPTWRVMAGYHHFFDKQATQSSNDHKLLSSGTNEYLFGMEYDICDRVQVSAGAQSTNFGMTDEYMKDMSFNVSSTSMGLGVGVRLTRKMKLNLAYFQTFYRTYDRYTNDYNKVSSVVALAKGSEAAQALVNTGVLGGSDAFTRTNKVIGVGLDIDF